MARIAIASDHAGFQLKTELTTWLEAGGHEVTDLGPSTGERVDYSDYGYDLAEHIALGQSQYGIAICGSGIGISIAVNRHPGCRCALVSEPVAARLSREHNDANVIALGARLVEVDTAKACVQAFLTTDFARGRHVLRVEKLGAPPGLTTTEQRR
ncbi:ribose 5-phosphate isomerase B [Caulobacter vibrioides]|uniref:ribose 5-phosphate isomerase B n=1 Tax=Caulobacter vibrioides TaxID=155892 RepID=UPI000BB525E2|nr:ribose 5-phosphate isomerase B [Caulobacter vibrioides]ATC24742.1 ribose 5-phosphate isomerase B [Caulobacter vibrioides]PLR09518.1 ribose 5-phosphate isomerase B [Caulobacter vibrioides]